MLQQFIGQYLGAIGLNSPVQLREATLIDGDLIRGNGATETLVASNGFRLFDGVQEVVFGQGIVTVNNGEAVTTVTFTDGTALTGVLALFDRQDLSCSPPNVQFLLDLTALAGVGKTLADVATVRRDAFVDHDLNWSDFGLVPTGISAPDPDPVPEPEAEPPLNLVQGTARNDQLIGADGDDLIRGGAGSDRLTGGAGADAFVLGAEARNGVRERDIITDFDAAEDSIVFEAGATIRFIEQRQGNLFIQLEGDRDAIVVWNAVRGVVANFVFTDDIFIA